MSAIDFATTTINAMFSAVGTFLTQLLPVIVGPVIAIGAVLGIWFLLKRLGRSV